jgi:hypothetical protein
MSTVEHLCSAYRIVVTLLRGQLGNLTGETARVTWQIKLRLQRKVHIPPSVYLVTSTDLKFTVPCVL